MCERNTAQWKWHTHIYTSVVRVCKTAAWHILQATTRSIQKWEKRQWQDRAVSFVAWVTPRVPHTGRDNSIWQACLGVVTDAFWQILSLTFSHSVICASLFHRVFTFIHEVYFKLHVTLIHACDGCSYILYTKRCIKLQLIFLLNWSPIV